MKEIMSKVMFHFGKALWYWAYCLIASFFSMVGIFAAFAAWGSVCKKFDL